MVSFGNLDELVSWVAACAATAGAIISLGFWTCLLLIWEYLPVIGLLIPTTIGFIGLLAACGTLCCIIIP